MLVNARTPKVSIVDNFLKSNLLWLCSFLPSLNAFDRAVCEY
jgi:hypothetical protein